MDTQNARNLEFATHRPTLTRVWKIFSSSCYVAVTTAKLSGPAPRRQHELRLKRGVATPAVCPLPIVGKCSLWRLDEERQLIRKTNPMTTRSLTLVIRLLVGLMFVVGTESPG